MEKITLNGKRYIELGELNHLRSNLVKDIFERYDKDENGRIHLSEVDIAKLDAYMEIAHGVMEDEIRSAETSDEIIQMRNDIEAEWMRDRYVIVGKDEQDGKRVYFREMCRLADGRIEDGADPKPVFTTKKRLARTWSDHYKAQGMLSYLSSATGNETLEVVPLWLEYGDARKRLLHAIFGDDDETAREGESDD